MPPVRLPERFRSLLRLGGVLGTPRPTRRRGPVIHVVIMDGTMSSLEEGMETNAGLTYKLLCELVPARDLSLWYESGIPWQGWRRAVDVIAGKGINQRIRDAYGFVASRYRPGDRIFLLGFSRGAYAARSLAGVIDRVGLLRAEHATERNIREVYRHYQGTPGSPASLAFARALCHPEAPIEMVGVWDTVKALGINMPLLWRLSPMATEFHNHHVGASIRHAFHALALGERRVAYEPVLWDSLPGWGGHLEQVWFRGTHGDVGGHLSGFERARPLANIPLVWMLEKMEGCGLILPEGWRARFPQDPGAPSVGMWRGWGKFFLWRRARRVGADPSESLHPTATGYRFRGWRRLQGVPVGAAMAPEVNEPEERV